MKTYHGLKRPTGCELAVSKSNGGWHRLTDKPLETARDVALTILGHHFGSTHALMLCDEFASEVIGSSLSSDSWDLEEATINQWVQSRRMSLAQE